MFTQGPKHCLHVILNFHQKQVIKTICRLYLRLKFMNKLYIDNR